jgi:hypothetical protein
MAVKNPCELQKEISNKESVCHFCDHAPEGQEHRPTPVGEVFYVRVFRDWDDLETDVNYHCSKCAESRGLVAEYNSEENQRDIKWYAGAWDRHVALEEEIRQEREDAKRTDGHNRQRKRQAHRKACASARRAHWVDKINLAFKKGAVA